MRAIGTLIIAAFLVAAPGVQEVVAQDDPTVAVMDFTGFMLGEGGNSVNLGKAVSAMLVTEFSGRDGLNVVERQALNDLLQEQRLALSGRVDESSAIEVGKLLGVQYMFYGGVTSVGPILRMDIRAVDVETSEILTVLKKSDAPTALLDILVEVADEFGDALNLVRPSERAEAPEIPVSAIIEFSRAVDYEDKGEMDSAVQHYEATLEIYPSHQDAQRALDRLRGGA